MTTDRTMQDHALAPPNFEQEDKPVNDKTFTTEGLVIRNVEKVARIRHQATKEDVSFRSWQFSRLVRRDFYLLSHKLFQLRIGRPRDRIRRQHLLEDVRQEANALETLALRYECRS